MYSRTMPQNDIFQNFYFSKFFAGGGAALKFGLRLRSHSFFICILLHRGITINFQNTCFDFLSYFLLHGWYIGLNYRSKVHV